MMGVLRFFFLGWLLVKVNRMRRTHDNTSTTNNGVAHDDVADMSSSTAAADAPSDTASPNVGSPTNNLSYTVELFENERWFPLSGWCPKRLPSDRPHFSSKDGKKALDPLHWNIPNGYEWIGDWSVDKDHPKGNDPEGWRYGFAWGTSFQPGMSPSTFVRRRRWIRTMILTPPTSAAVPTKTDGGERSSPPRDVYSVNNESFDACSVPSTTVPPARSKRNITRRQQEGDQSSIPANSETKAIQGAPLESRVAATTDEGEGFVSNSSDLGKSRHHHHRHHNHKADAEVAQHADPQDVDPDVYNDDDIAVDVAPSASMRYFAERQATSSVIGGNRDKSEPNGSNDQEPTGVETHEDITTTALPASNVQVPMQRNPFEPDEDNDEDAAFYGFGITPAAHRGDAPAAIQLVTSSNDEGLSFQKTLSEIVEDVDRAEAVDKQVWEQHQQSFGGVASSLMPGSPFAAPDEEDTAAEDAFSNMLCHFVSKAKEGVDH
jgi:hypothetical protein